MGKKITDLINERLAQYGPSPKSRYFHEFYFPSLASVRFSSLVVLFLLILSQLDINLPAHLGVIAPSDEINDNLLIIHAGIGAIIIALLIFVAESLRDEAKDRARVLLRESMLFPLALLEILVFFVFLFGKVNYLAVLPVVGVGVFTIVAIYKMVAILLNRTEFAQKRKMVLRERFRHSLNLAINTRIGQNAFLKMINDDSRLATRIYGAKRRPNREVFAARQYGVVVDVDIDVLREVADKLNAGRKGLFDWGSDVSETDSSSKRKIVLHVAKLYNARVSPADDILCYIDETLEPQKKNEIEKLIAHAFKIGPYSGFSEAVKSDISSLKDQMLTAISEKHTGKAEELADVYVGLIQEFLAYLSQYKATYSLEDANKELHSIGGGWPEIEWLRRDIREVFIKAIASEDYHLADEIIYLPTAFVREALEHKDQYVFQTFVGFSRLLYSRVAVLKESEFKGIMLDMVSQQLTEMAHYMIQPKIREQAELKKTEELVAFKEFAIYLFVVFQGLLKEAFEKRDVESFAKYKNAVVKLFDHLGDGYGDSEIEIEISEKRNQMFFHLASWLVDLRALTPEGESTKSYFEMVDNEVPTDLTEIEKLFWLAHDRGAEDFWGWSWWGLEDDGEVHTIDVSGRLERYFVIRLLQILTSAALPGLVGASLKPRREYVHLSGPSGGFGMFLAELNENPSKWAAVVSEEMRQQIPALEKLFQDAVGNYRTQEVASIRKASISPTKVNTFKKDVVAGLAETGRLRNVLSLYGLISDKTDTAAKSDKRFGINTVFDKAAFFDAWHVYYGDIGKRYGEGLVSGENAYLLDKIAEKCAKVDGLASLNLQGSHWFILTTDFDWNQFVGDESKYKFKHDAHGELSKMREFEGTCLIAGKELPVFHIFRKDGKKQFLILNSKKMGGVVYFDPTNTPEEADRVSDGLYIHVRAFSESKEDLDALLKTPPEWLKSKGDSKAQENHLLEHVLINILEKFEYVSEQKIEGYSLKINKPHRYSR